MAGRVKNKSGQLTESDIRNLDFSKFTNREIVAHFNGRCQICGSTWGVSCHHIIFVSQGGQAGPRLPLCITCHAKLHGEGGFRKKHEDQLFRIAGTFYFLKSGGFLDVDNY